MTSERRGRNVRQLDEFLKPVPKRPKSPTMLHHQFAADVSSICRSALASSEGAGVARRYAVIGQDLYREAKRSLCPKCQRKRVTTFDTLPRMLEGLQTAADGSVGGASAQFRYNLVSMLGLACPEYVFPLGFDAVRYVPASSGRTASLQRRGELLGDDWCDRCQSIVTPLLAGPAAWYRAYGGRWVSWPDIQQQVLEMPYGKEVALIDFADRVMSTWGHKIEHWTNTTSADEEALIMSWPALWRPMGSQLDPSDCGIRDVLSALRMRHFQIAKVPWRDLEEIVAELLRARGMKVHVTPRSRDGGRDIVATGELIPGEPAVLAVEVKQKPVVGIGDLRAALWANRKFPALLFATAGRFSAGVFRERRRGDNALRLYLKDGNALREWIDAYADNVSYRRRRAAESA